MPLLKEKVHGAVGVKCDAFNNVCISIIHLSAYNTQTGRVLRVSGLSLVSVLKTA